MKASKNEERVYSDVSTAGWDPLQGDTTAALGRYLVQDSKELPDSSAFGQLVGSSLEILRRCKPMTATDGSRTGLVVGYVQSGKTMSMSTVASLARDNGCRIVILLAGVTENLLKQTARDRIRPYLLSSDKPGRGWRPIDTVESPDLTSQRSQLNSWVDEWARGDVPEARKRPVFLTVMKNHAHLGSLATLLQKVRLEGVPCLIIDDEADQAGLDTRAKQRAAGKDVAPSTTYQRIAEIRRALPNHSYLQYTATPQAPLLISLADILSPDFAYVLAPGRGYTGGKAFFGEHPELVVEIPTSDLFDPSSPPDEPPDSLILAMREFVVGTAAAFLRGEKGPRSMLIHPSSRRSDHDAFWRFTQRVCDRWRLELRLPMGESVRVAAEEDFKATYQELSKTDRNLPPFQEILTELPLLLADTLPWKVNSEDGHEVDWERGYSHILVGGDKLNRGFTVKGLTVTYMPRTPGGWNADTIQQRARFFGYKEHYLGLCRVHLHPDVASAYRDYVMHEEDIRSQLQRHKGSLKDWKRAFLLDQPLHPTRSNVLSESLHRSLADQLFAQNHPHEDLAMVAKNHARVQDLIEFASAHSQFVRDSRHDKHLVAQLPLADVFRKFVVDYECAGADAADWAALAMNLGAILHDAPKASCRIVLINGGDARIRTETSPGRVQLFEGRRASGGDVAYKGDKSFVFEDSVTLQLHHLEIQRTKDSEAFIKGVRALAVFVPSALSGGDFIFQGKRGQ